MNVLRIAAALILLGAAVCAQADVVDLRGPSPWGPRPSWKLAPRLPPSAANRNRVSSGFGWRRHPILGGIRRHLGVDLPKPYGTPVYPARKGVVSFAGWKSGYGWMIELKHGDGTRTIYGHLSRYFYVKGQSVRAGTPVGLVGSSGLSTGPHLHFEYHDASGRAVDPPRGFLDAVL